MLDFVNTENQLVDIFTKPLHGERFFVSMRKIEYYSFSFLKLLYFNYLRFSFFFYQVNFCPYQKKIFFKYFSSLSVFPNIRAKYVHLLCD